MTFNAEADLGRITLKMDFEPVFDVMVEKMVTRIPKYAWGYQTCDIEILRERVKEEFKELEDKEFDDFDELVDLANITAMLIYRKLQTMSFVEAKN